ncbi:MAG TPA: hypothetical protein PKD86_11410 [Gemmatales bacterium]|nr:hypothetical protein [Gemmatales bacterium]HMP59950.1 hypothetical protein [Gemmatales bacterium]
MIPISLGGALRARSYSTVAMWITWIELAVKSGQTWAGARLGF